MTQPTRTLRSLRIGLFTFFVCALTSCGGGAIELDDDVGHVASGGEAAPSIEALAIAAVSEDRVTAERAIASLRAEGPRGHAALMASHAAQIAILRDAPPVTPSAADERLRHAIDLVSGQRDGHASGLYWHTDLEAAEREARETGRPILSLRLLGRLDEEMSCANSRYFRLVLYPNREVSQFLRERYVMHWSSERPVPRITIDMGDGRRLERTITGNSIHYVLDADGLVIDAMPGLLGPREMLAFVNQAEEMHAALTGARESDLGSGEAAITAGHALVLGRALIAYRAARTDFPTIPDRSGTVLANGLPSAIDAMPLTVSKVAVEAPMLDAMRAPAAAPVAVGTLDWARVGIEAYDRDPSSVFDDTSRALLRLKTGRDDAASAELIAALSRTIVGDSARNAATFRLSVLEWLSTPRAEGTARPDLALFNERVYRELFLTPASDPWLGLQDPTVWDAIERLH